MTTSESRDLVLDGCAPVPLAGYLKALGVFRLVAEQADKEARGFWRNERFVLRTRLSKDALVRFS
jgi:CRISPR-associated protein Csx17